MILQATVILLSLSVASSYSESVHWQWRELTCKGAATKAGATSCEISLKEDEKDTDGRIAPINPCIEETEANGKPRSHCNVLCPGADTVYLIKRSPSNHRSCFGHISYKIEKRDGEFFLWRDGKCRSSDVTFTIRCEFAFGRKEFPADPEVFAATKKLLAA